MNGSGRFQHRARVLHHLDGEYTQVALEATGAPGAGPRRVIPTRIIPPHLRQIGSRFLLDGRETDLTQPIGAIREMLADQVVRELPSVWLPITAETLTGTLAVEEVFDLPGRGPVALGAHIGGTLQAGMQSLPMSLQEGVFSLTIRAVEFADSVSARGFRIGLFFREAHTAADLRSSLSGQDLLFGPAR